MLRPNTERLWQDSEDCSCGRQDCNPRNHKKCNLCGELMLYGSHFTNEATRDSQYAWNIDLIIPKCDGGKVKITNQHAVHIKCNKSKKNVDQSCEYEK